MMCDATIDKVVVDLNAQAASIMRKWNIPTVDMHAAITGQCGPPPNANCFNTTSCFCPHCGGNGGVGYSWLANTTIAPAIRKLLA